MLMHTASSGQELNHLLTVFRISHCCTFLDACISHLNARDKCITDDRNCFIIILGK